MIRSNKYPSIMYLLTVIVLILILFSFVDILNQIPKNKTKQITGLAIDTNQTNLQESGELYSQSSYLIFYIMILVIFLLITFFLAAIILPRIKHLT